MDYYDVSCELDKIVAKIECFAEMIGALAEAEVDQRASGTYWFIYDTAKQYASEIETLSGKVMENHKSSAIKIQNAPTEGNFTREEILTAIKKAKKGKKK